MLSKSINQNLNIWFINCKINCSSIRHNQSIVQFHWSFFYSFVRHIISIIARIINIYLFICSTIFFRICTSIFHYSFFSFTKYLSRTYAFVNQIDSFFSFLFKKTIWIIKISIYLFDNFFQNLFEHFHHNSKYLTKIYAFANQIDAFFSFSFKKFFNSISIRFSWILFFCSFVTIEFRIFFLWRRYLHTTSD